MLLRVCQSGGSQAISCEYINDIGLLAAQVADLSVVPQALHAGRLQVVVKCVGLQNLQVAYFSGCHHWVSLHISPCVPQLPVTLHIFRQAAYAWGKSPACRMTRRFATLEHGTHCGSLRVQGCGRTQLMSASTCHC